METIGQPHREHDTPAVFDTVGAGSLNEEQACRARIYGLLAALLAAPPTARILETLSLIDDSPEAGPMTPAWRALKQAAEAGEPEALDDEYHALFIGVGRGELLPYCSWYLTGFLMERPLALLRGTLQSLGIERQADVREPEDHVAALCETMSLIIASEDEIGFARQQAFFNDYVGAWMGQFCRDLRKAEGARFYRAVGRLGEEFMTIEQRYFEMMA